MAVYRLSGYPVDLNSGRGRRRGQTVYRASRYFCPRNRVRRDTLNGIANGLAAAAARVQRLPTRPRARARARALAIPLRLFTVEILFTIVLTRSRTKGPIPRRGEGADERDEGDCR